MSKTVQGAVPAASAKPARTAKTSAMPSPAKEKNAGKPAAKKSSAKPASPLVTAASPADTAPTGKSAARKSPASKTPTSKTPTSKTPTSKTPANKPASPKRKQAIEADKLPPAALATPAVPKAGSKLEKNLANRQAASLTAPVRIFQIYFEAWQKELLDPAFAPLNNAGTAGETLEFDVFERLARSEYVRGATLWGALSWRFAEKTGMGGNELIKAIAAAPGMDVYYCNPHPQNEALFHNLWTQGETSHPRFLALARALFQAAGLPEEELSSIEASGRYSCANYFVASPAFWSKYLPFVRKILATADKKLSPEARKLLHSSLADQRGLHRGASYVPFMVERLFPLFLKTEGRNLKAHKLALPEREREMNVHLKLLRDMKDVAHRTKSPWMAACWVNYRNLYLSQVNGRAWCQKYLRAVTPTEIKFG